MIVEGIDVSNWQKEIDWQAVADHHDVGFVWVKATEGTTFNDPFFLHNVASARAVGIPTGGYHFGRPSQSPADVQAQHFRAYCGRLDLPAMGDAEGGWLTSVQANTDWWLRFLDNLGEPHRVLYTNRNGALVHLDSNRLVAEGVDLFYAHPTDGAGNPWPHDNFEGVGSWAQASVLQYGARPVAGIAGLVDADTMLDTTLARYLGGAPNPPGDDMQVAPVITSLADTGELVIVPGDGSRPWSAPAADQNLIAVFVFRVLDPDPSKRWPFPSPVPSLTDAGQIASVRHWLATSAAGGAEHLVGTVDVHQAP